MARPRCAIAALQDDDRIGRKRARRGPIVRVVGITTIAVGNVRVRRLRRRLVRRRAADEDLEQSRRRRRLSWPRPGEVARAKRSWPGFSSAVTSNR